MVLDGVKGLCHEIGQDRRVLITLISVCVAEGGRGASDNKSKTAWFSQLILVLF
jgi:hypothetical protein